MGASQKFFVDIAAFSAAFPAGRQCTGCKRVLPATSFAYRAKGTGTASARCRACLSQKNSARNAKDPGRNHRLAALTPEERQARRRAMKRANSARYRATEYGRQQRDRRDRKWYSAVIAWWESQGVELRCLYCGGPFEHIDHFIPRARGGTDEFSNLVPACADCNWRKNDRDPHEWLVSINRTDLLP